MEPAPSNLGIGLAPGGSPGGVALGADVPHREPKIRGSLQKHIKTLHAQRASSLSYSNLKSTVLTVLDDSDTGDADDSSVSDSEPIDINQFCDNSLRALEKEQQPVLVSNQANLFITESTPQRIISERACSYL